MTFRVNFFAYENSSSIFIFQSSNTYFGSGYNNVDLCTKNIYTFIIPLIGHNICQFTIIDVLRHDGWGLIKDRGDEALIYLSSIVEGQG